MRINPDLIGEYHSELEEANIDYKEYDRPSDEWFLNKINYKNLDGEFSYFNENNNGQQRHYAEVINEYKQELAAKQGINVEVMDVIDGLPETALEADYEEDLKQDISIKASKIIKDFNTQFSADTEFTSGLLNYLYFRSINQEAGIESVDNFLTLFESYVVKTIQTEKARQLCRDKINEYENMKIDFDADNIDFRYVELIDRTEAKKLNEELVSLKETYPKTVENLRKKGSEKNRFIENINVQNTSEIVATNFLLEKLNKAGIETIIDKVAYENMLAYVKEVNICLEMLEAEQYPVQMMGEKEKGLEQDKQNILPPTSSKPTRKYITSIAACQAFSLKFEKLKTMITDSTPERFLQQLKETLETNDELDSNYVRRKIDGQKTELRISDHFSHAFDARFVDKTDSIVIKLTNNHFKPYKNAVLNEYVYHADTLTPEKKEQIIQGIQDWFITGEYTDKNYDDFHISPKEELQQNLAEQMTLGGIKKGLMTGVALVTMFCNMPKLAAETKITNPDEYKQTQIVQMETSLDIIHFEDGTKAICNTGNKNNLLNIAIILDESGKPVACHNYDDYMKLLETTGAIEKATVTKTNPIEVSMDVKKFVPFVNDWQQIGVVSDAFGGGSISEFDQQKYINLLNGWLTGEYSKQAQFMIQDSLTYGFTLNNKIYLNPEIVNSNTIAHEYTHLWDKYTQKENPALWEHGKEIFKQTSLWNEVINDGNYKAISNNEDLILSECHSRICGKFAEEVLNKIAKENGNEIKEEVIDWDKEVELFIAKEFGIKNPNYEMSNSINVKEQLAQENYNEFKNFLSQPMKDLIAGKDILKEHIIDNVELEKKYTNTTELNESINNDIPVMPNVSDLQHSESNEVQILKKEVDELKAALKQVQSQFEHQKKENNTLRQENELLKGKNNNINATQNVKETGEEREIRIPHQLRDMIIMQAMKNPWRQDLSAFVFFSKTRADRPMDTDAWAVYMRRALKSIGYPNLEKICFHSFRHSWCTTTLSEIGDQRICMIGSGHKTDKVFAHYANHIKKESALETIAKTSERLFAPIFEELSITDIEYCICDEAAAKAGNNKNLIPFILDEEAKNERETTLG